MIYLDDAATSRPKHEAIRVMNSFLYDQWYNPSSLHTKAMEVSAYIKEARRTIAKEICANDLNEIYFTSGGSESNCWAIRGFVDQVKANGFKSLIISTNIEHDSITRCLGNLNDNEYWLLSVDNHGFVSPDSLERMLQDAKNQNDIFKALGVPQYKVLVSIQFANNEIGTIQDIGVLSEICHQYDAYFHVDAVQAFCRIPINVIGMKIDMLSASGHKIGAPKGIGFLYIKNGVQIKPLIYGSQEGGLRGGTENVAGILAFKKAVEVTRRDFHYPLRMTVLRNNFLHDLESMGCTLNGDRYERLPNNINVTLGCNVTAESMIYLLETANIIVSAGSACKARSSSPSHVLKAIGLSDEEALRTLRITLPDDITADQIEEAVREIKNAMVILSGS